MKTGLLFSFHCLSFPLCQSIAITIWKSDPGQPPLTRTKREDSQTANLEAKYQNQVGSFRKRQKTERTKLKFEANDNDFFKKVGFHFLLEQFFLVPWSFMLTLAQMVEKRSFDLLFTRSRRMRTATKMMLFLFQQNRRIISLCAILQAQKMHGTCIFAFAGFSLETRRNLLACKLEQSE